MANIFVMRKKLKANKPVEPKKIEKVDKLAKKLGYPGYQTMMEYARVANLLENIVKLSSSTGQDGANTGSLTDSNAFSNCLDNAIRGKYKC